MDTFKELQILEDLYGRGKAPWAGLEWPALNKNAWRPVRRA